MTAKHKLTIGADIEVFLKAQNSDEMVPCVGLVEGTKDNPYTPPKAPPGFMLQEDNVMLEFNVKPSESTTDFMDTMYRAHDYLYNYVNTKLKLDISTKTCHKFRIDQLMTPQAQRFGCDPDFDAYNGGLVREVPDSLVAGQNRSCGGHIHLGGPFNAPEFVSALFADLFFSTKTQNYSQPGTRTQWYGRPGVYRPKPYGIEYRSPDASWFTRGSFDAVGEAMFSCMRFLSYASASKIYETFNSVPWLEFRKQEDRAARQAMAVEIVNGTACKKYIGSSLVY